MNYTRVLILTIGRINAADTDNNGLLLRNLFAKWPKQNLAQIYSSGDNGDCGFFGRYYQLGPRDRCFGELFYKLKTRQLEGKNKKKSGPFPEKTIREKKAPTRDVIKQLLIDTGLYELIFRPRLSGGMISWVKDFQPDIIFAQGYCLTFAWLPVMLANSLTLPVAYYPTDDWPQDACRLRTCSIPLMPKLVKYTVVRAARQLVEVSSVLLAFNRYMQDEYLRRYKKEFVVLMHGDELSRYQPVQPIRLAADDECWIVCTGVFGSSRLPLLYDLEHACKILNAKGFKARATVFPVNDLSEIASNLGDFRYVNFEPCPSHSDLVSVLKGADILFLPERFDETAQSIRFSISSKAHLFMFSGKPIVVYSAPVTGIAQYAKEAGWASVLDYRDTVTLSKHFERIIRDSDVRNSLVKTAERIAVINHDLKTIQSTFENFMKKASFRNA